MPTFLRTFALMIDERRIRLLTLCPLFHGMTEREIVAVTDGVPSRVVKYGRKRIYQLRGEPCTHADILLHGEMSAEMSGTNGRVVNMGVIGAGALMMPNLIFADDKSSPLTITTRSEVEVLRISIAGFKRIIDSNETVRMNFIRHLSNFCILIDERLRTVSLHSTRRKLIEFIISEAKSQQSAVITLRQSRQELADYFGIQKPSLIRSLSELAAEGCISVRGKQIEILNRAGLK